MRRSWATRITWILAGILVAGSLAAMDINKLPPDNWSVARGTGVHTMTDATSPRPFIGLPPCRIVDTRGTPGVPITGGAFAANEARTWTFTGLCGLPVGADAVSLNITVTNTGGQTAFGFVKVWPGGATEPTVSTLNWAVAGVTESNAAIVPLGTGANAGRISLRSGNNSSDVIVDINGYFSDILGTPGNYFELNNASFFWSILTNNAFASCFGPCGIISSIAGTGSQANAVEGNASGTSGITYGVHGNTNSITSRAAGVEGDDGSTVANRDAGFSFSTGVLGFGRNGVGGLSSTGGGFGVFGVLENTAGTVTGEGLLGFGTFGVYASTGNLGCGGCVKSFVDPHPTDPTKTIHYVSLEGNEAGTYFRGTATTVDGNYIIEVPEDFRYVTDSEGLTVQLTPVGAPATMYVVSEDLNRIVVQSSADVKFHYLVQGIRPAFKDFKVIQNDPELFLLSRGESRMPEAWTGWMKQRLIANGTYNADGTVNMETAERAGWAQAWRQQDEKMKAESEANAAAIAARSRRPAETP